MTDHTLQYYNGIDHKKREEISVRFVRAIHEIQIIHETLEVFLRSPASLQIPVLSPFFSSLQYFFYNIFYEPRKFWIWHFFNFLLLFFFGRDFLLVGFQNVTFFLSLCTTFGICLLFL